MKILHLYVFLFRSNLTPKLNKLPELASNLRRKMSDNFKSREHLNLSSASSELAHSSHSIFPETPEDSDLEDEAPVSSSRREPLIFPSMSLSSGSGGRNMSGALYVFSRKKKQFQVSKLDRIYSVHEHLPNSILNCENTEYIRICKMTKYKYQKQLK